MITHVGRSVSPCWPASKLGGHTRKEPGQGALGGLTTPVPFPAAYGDLRRPTQCNAWRYDQAMARNIGPDMLANLDMQRDTGKITAAQYEARRTEVLELIRKGKTVDYSRPERLAIIIGGLLATLLGIVALLSGFSTSNVGQIVLGLAFATLGLLALRRIA